MVNLNLHVEGVSMNQADQLFNTLTRIHTDFRYGALTAVADMNRDILHGNWGRGNDGCLFAIAAAGAKRRALKVGERNDPIVAEILGLTQKEVTCGIQIWDSELTIASRQELRIRIGRYIAETYPERSNECLGSTMMAANRANEPMPVHAGVLASAGNRVGAGIGLAMMFIVGITASLLH